MAGVVAEHLRAQRPLPRDDSLSEEGVRFLGSPGASAEKHIGVGAVRPDLQGFTGQQDPPPAGRLPGRADQLARRPLGRRTIFAGALEPLDDLLRFIRLEEEGQAEADEERSLRRPDLLFPAAGIQLRFRGRGQRRHQAFEEREGLRIRPPSSRARPRLSQRSRSPGGTSQGKSKLTVQKPSPSSMALSRPSCSVSHCSRLRRKKRPNSSSAAPMTLTYRRPASTSGASTATRSSLDSSLQGAAAKKRAPASAKAATCGTVTPAPVRTSGGRSAARSFSSRAKND